MAGNLQAAEWIFNPYIGMSETYTDNAYGTASDEQDDAITTLRAGFEVEGIGRRLQLRAAYDVGYNVYARFSELNGFDHNLLASGNAELISDNLFLETDVALTEERYSSDGTTAYSDRSGTGDNTRVLNTRISPYYQHDFGGYATGIIRYTHSMVSFTNTNSRISGSEPNDSDTNRIDLTLQSGREFSRTKWAVEAFAFDNQVDNGDDLKRSTMKADGQVPINRYVALLASGGWDEFDGDNINNDKISGAFYGAGVRLTPGPRTDLSLQVGHRFGGGVVDADFTYLISSEARFIAGYHVDVAGSGSSFANARILDQNGDLVNPNTFAGGYSDSIAKTKTFSMGLSGEKGRNSYSATASYITRKFLSYSADESVASFDGSFTRQLSRRLGWDLGGGYSEIIDAQSAGGKEKAFYGQTGLSYQFTPTFIGSLAYGHYNRDSENNVDSLRENTVSISVRKEF
ncbi:TIGR03016 family PEP-CTERM system-associated outer membrane protein [Sneathiella sp.]|uniref:TIGR03016 family PEP-CTERM system-associated outer membrane protein n=1 Tax=Sneathiella sp. TaxID=1964365 RepID=UPI0025D270CF|nr:TIGR03016 family PEP-CTERM system-associated outer membrane protein [Sneathiella sp.]